MLAYEREPYLTRMEAEVLETGLEEGRFFAVASDTVFYPEGGGQPADRGMLAGAAVTDVQKRQGQVRHYLGSPIEKGPAVMELDWARRYDHMQQHTAQHLLSALAERTFGWQTTSFHLGPEQCDIELDTQEISEDEMRRLEDLLAEEVRAARTVQARRVTLEECSRLGVRSRGLPEGHQGDVRLVEIEGIDCTTCGGTHVASTAELESVALLGTTAMRGGTRLYFAAGSRVRRRLAFQEQLLSELRRLLGASDEQILEAVEARSEQLTQARRREKFLLQQLAQATAERLACSPEPVVSEHFGGQEMSFLQSVARSLIGQAAQKAAFLTAQTGQGALFVLAAGPESRLDAPTWGPRTAQLLDGRGGGSGGIFQGKAPSLKRRQEALQSLREAVGKAKETENGERRTENGRKG